MGLGYMVWEVVLPGQAESCEKSQPREAGPSLGSLHSTLCQPEWYRPYRTRSLRMNPIGSTVLIGFGATLVMDLWGIARKPLLGVPPPDYGLVGRWAGHMGHGQFRHASISSSPPVGGELVIGWAIHYLTGIAYAGMLVAAGGETWLRSPTLSMAMAVGIGTMAAPFLIMQPAMGAGIASSRARRPNAARLHTLLTHASFGFGLFLAGWALNMSGVLS